MIAYGINNQIKHDDECRFNRNVANLCGIRSAVIAQYLWEIMNNEENDLTEYWRRMPQKMIQTVFPFMTRDMIRYSLKKLVKHGVIRTCVMNEDKFDHTKWYQFTDYGQELMNPGFFA